jgi:peptidoglycan hydrolase-like protein with peptidoglycan-binding domain
VTYNGQNLWARRSRLRLGGGTAPPPPAGAPVATRRLERGLKGDDVKALQEALNRNGATLTADGNFGSATRAAVEAFQRAKGLTADGVAGRGTLAALGFKVDY